MFLKKSMPIIKIILKIILVLLIIIAILETAIFEIEKIKFINQVKKSGGVFISNNAKYSFKTDNFDINTEKKPTANFGTKHTILLFGCSFAYGVNIKNEGILSSQLAKKSQSTVYNMAFPGWGAQQILYQLKKPDFYKTIKPPDYIIYIFIEDHLNRLEQYQWGGGFWCNKINLRYKDNNGELQEIKPIAKSIWHFFIVQEIQHFIVNYKNTHNRDQNIKLFTKIMEESLKLTKQHYPKSKFIILQYSPEVSKDQDLNQMFKVLENKGFIVLKTDDILKEDLKKAPYHFANDFHPTEKAWEALTPALIKTLNL